MVGSDTEDTLARPPALIAAGLRCVFPKQPHTQYSVCSMPFHHLRARCPCTELADRSRPARSKLHYARDRHVVSMMVSKSEYFGLK
jgi:hypothetical protein